VLVTNRRFQFHDTSISAISETLALADARDQVLIPLSGWLQEPDQFLPIRLQPVKGQLDSWRNLRARLDRALRPQDTLASVIVQRDWLAKCLTECMQSKTASTALENALFEEASKPATDVAVTQPVFLLC
jgi:hypothetical protein